LRGKTPTFSEFFCSDTMETTKKKVKAQKANPVSAIEIRNAYRTYVLTEGKKPLSVFAFCKENGMAETDFYAFFGSFEGVEKSIWESYIVDTINRLGGDKDFALFTAREKLLTFYFSLAELLKSDRSFVVHQLKCAKFSGGSPIFLKSFKSAFEGWIEGILNEGKSTGEIAKRPFIDDRYSNVFWMHLLFVLNFWVRDDSPNFEKTDVAIEKSVTLAFDLIGKGVLDNALDFGKFLYQNSKS
jgi:hypothetical protein